LNQNYKTIMMCKPWTLALLGAGLVSVPALTQAEENTNAVPLLTALSATSLSGYVDTSAHWNFGTGNANLPPITPNGKSGSTKADGFNLNVVALTLSHPPGEGDWSAGYNATLLMGPDAVGYNNTFGTTGSELSLKDAYVELKAPVGNGLDIKMGTFAEVLGYEVYETANNPNYTRSYGYEIEPTSWTGLMLAYQFSSVISANGGIVNTWSPNLNSRANPPMAESYKAYFGSFTLTAPSDMGFLAGSTLSGGIVNGFDTGTATPKTSYYVGGTFKTPVTGLAVGAAFDYACLANNTVGGTPQTSGYQNAAGLYLIWQATEKLSFNSRGEFFSQSGYLASSGFPKQGVEVTETVTYQLWKNVVSRLEFRWDHASDADAYGSGLDNAFLLAANFVYKF
jgi:hypothetical protein